MGFPTQPKYRAHNIAIQRRFPPNTRVSSSATLIDFSTVATFTRASEAAFTDPRAGWTFQSSGSANWLGVNVPRIFSDGAILLESQGKTNFVSASRNPIQWAINNFGTASVTASATYGPDTFLSASILSGAAGIAFTKGQNITSALGYPNICSTYLMLVDVPSSAGVNVGVGKSMINPLTSAWVRYTSSFTVVTGVLQLYGLDTTVNSNKGMKYYADLFQYESGSFITSPVRTLFATGSRASELLKINNIGTVVPAEFFTKGWEVDLWPAYNSGTGSNWLPSTVQYVIGSDSAASARVLFENNATQVRVLAQTPGAVVNTGFFSWVAHDKITIKVDFVNHTCTVSKNGTLVELLTGFYGDWGTTAGHNWTIGNTAAAAFGFVGVISQFRKI